MHAVLFIASLAVLNGPTQGSWPLPGAYRDQALAVAVGLQAGVVPGGPGVRT